MWQPKMNPNMLEEELSGGFNKYALLAIYQNDHLREAIHNHKKIVIPCLVEGSPDM